ncbi:MAG: hypothetical protein IKO31_00595, partial [Bacteroidales bacterium]|nr:hypothetical protein [Bacteroidales bacterium]
NPSFIPSFNPSIDGIFDGLPLKYGVSGVLNRKIIRVIQGALMNSGLERGVSMKSPGAERPH